MVISPCHLTWHTNTSKKFYKVIISAYLKLPPSLDLQPTLDIRLILVKPIYHVNSSVFCHFAHNSTSFGQSQGAWTSFNQLTSFIINSRTSLEVMILLY